MLSDIHVLTEWNKKGGTIRNLFCSEVPPSTLQVNKYE